ncbi:HSF-type DNA-binding-domain-containing protein [Gilbertella persicaria]|uniref:HSF-type DNA-binding-domain-containing protein n=1 Tax=Gilbertella persicaria TaxID=101096 RepID=UPI0022210C25|nr:HSF-type DNA-binding-domain-containing protein [Gilbertella persicaria]KAI8048156.1 HSF-type DNA-binding-domain-containing protein [Gilbertella persicaria]
MDMFIIDCIPKFTEIVLPRLFKHCKFASFVRQLNIYGFQRDTDARKSKDVKDKKTCRWYHIYFRPNRRDLFHLIRRRAPRYARRKKLQANPTDTETIITNESDEDEFLYDEHASANEMRRSDSSSSSYTTWQQRNNSFASNMTDHLNPILELHDMYDDHHQTQHYTQQRSSSLHSFDNQSFHEQPLNFSQHAFPPPPPPALLSYDTNGALQDQRSRRDTTLQTMMYDEKILQEKLAQWKDKYSIMFKSLTGQVEKASNLIEIQKSRIQCLENAVFQYEQQLRTNHYYPEKFAPQQHTLQHSTTRNQQLLDSQPIYSDKPLSSSMPLEDKWMPFFPHHNTDQIGGLTTPSSIMTNNELTTSFDINIAMDKRHSLAE